MNLAQMRDELDQLDEVLSEFERAFSTHRSLEESPIAKHLCCAEADALEALLRELGMNDMADNMMDTHRASDEEDGGEPHDWDPDEDEDDDLTGRALYEDPENDPGVS